MCSLPLGEDIWQSHATTLTDGVIDPAWNNFVSEAIQLLRRGCRKSDGAGTRKILDPTKEKVV